MPTDIDQNLVNDVQVVAAKLGTQVLSRSEYFQHGQFSHYQVYDGGHTWEDVCKAAGLSHKKKEPVSDEEYYNRLSVAIAELGRYPKASERKKYGLSFSKRRYSTLIEFIRKAIELGRAPNLFDAVPILDEEDKLDVQPLQSEMLPTPTRKRKRFVPPIPLQTNRTKWERTGVDGFPYAPHDELGVASLLGILCSKGTIRWQILEMRGSKEIDITCYDEVMEKSIRVELKYTLSKGSWNHRIEDLDFVVCWENRWPDFPKPVLVLSELIKTT